MKTARHIDRMPAPNGTIHPTRTDVREVIHAVERSEIAWGRYYHSGTDEKKREWKAAHARVRRLVELLADEKRPGGGSRSATPGHGPEESEATSKVADAPAAGNSGRNGRYVATVGSPGGVVDERYYADFAAMVTGARELAERYPHPDRQIVCGNVDEADIDHDGLTDAERELLEELL